MYPGRKSYFLFILFLWFCITGKAEYNCIFEHLSTEDGLSHGSVSAMLKDSRGFMWFATWDGINRYDGHTFKTFKPGNYICSNIASNRIETIKEDAIGNIWVVNYDSKAFRLNRFTETFDAVPAQPASIPTNIKGIYPVSSGDVWLATNNSGAFRVITDTVTNSFTVLQYNDSSKIYLPGNDIHFVKEDAQKNIWINTNKGLGCFEFNTVRKTLSPKSFPAEFREILNHHTIICFYGTASQIFLGTADGTVLFYNSSDKFLKEISFGNKAEISNITGDYNGSVFYGTTGNGMFQYDLNAGKVTKHYNQPGIQNVLRAYADSHGMLWIESAKAGISKIDIATGKYRHYQQIPGVNEDLRSSAQCGIMEDEDRTVWLTLKGGGFGYYNPETDDVEYFFNKPGDPQSKISNFVNCFYKDYSGVLWLSTYFKGIEKITFIQQKFRFVQPASQSKLSIANEVRALLEDSKGYLWVATKNEELFLLDKDFNIVKKFNQIDGEKTGRVYAMLEDSKGNIYLGSKGNGLFKLIPNGAFNFRVKHYLHDPDDSSSLSNNNIYSLLEDQKGRIWIGTYGGGANLFFDNHFLNPQNGFKKYPENKGQKVRYITKDKSGNLWMGTTDGVILVKPEGELPQDYAFHFFNQGKGNVHGLRDNDIFWIFCDRQNNIWLTSLGGGLARLENSNPGEEKTLNFLTLTKTDGLPTDMIFTITNDENGNLWMSTESGIAYYNPNEQIFRSYSRYDGIVNSGFSEAAMAVRKDGSICFGANNGLYNFKPSNFKDDQKKVDIVFTGFQLFGKEISPGNGSALNVSITESSSVRLEYNQNVFGITWAGLDFKLQNKIHYAYMLEGFDDNWRYTQGVNQANYTKIPPGKYTFRVKFSNPELQKFNHPKSISIKILPPWWKTTWAYIIYLIIAIGLVETARRIITSMIRLRNKVVIEKELTNIKLNFFTNISHELRTPLTLILEPVKELKSKEKLSKKGKEYANLIELNAQRLLRLVNQLLDFRKVQSNKMELELQEVNLVPFIRKVCHNFDELARKKDIRFEVKCPVNSIFISIDEEKMNGVLYNILSNAFKFTPDYGTVEVLVSELKPANKIQIEIKDSGTGIPTEQEKSLFTIFSSYHGGQPKYTGTGIGLALSKELVELHHGELSYKPTPGGGATFVIDLNSGNVPIKQGTIAKDETPGESLPKNETAPDNSTHQKPENKYCILIVEDNQELRNFLRLQLDDEYFIEEAANGREGLSKALKSQPDIILSDIMMPEMDGIQLLEQIKNNFETSHIPVVLLTARSSVESKIEGLKYGADAYMTKPFSSGQLKAQLKNLLHQRILLRERYARQTKTDVPLSGVNLTDKDAAFLDQVRNIIEANLTRTNFKIEDIYSQAGMGRSKFFDKLKGLTGLSPIDFVKEYRLNKAQSLLKSGKYNVTETSYLSGFTDAGYFSKCYKERFGISPSQVREK